MGFIMDGLDAESYDRTYSDRTLVARIWGYFRPHLGIMLSVAALIVLNSLMDTALPILLSQGIDVLAQSQALETAALLVGAILLAGALSWLFNFIRQWYTARLIGAVVLHLRTDIFKAVMARDMSFFDEYSSGRIISRVTSDSDQFTTVVTLTLSLMSQLLLVVIIFGVLFFINTGLALLTLLLAPVIVLIALSFRRIARQAIQQTMRAGANVNGIVQEAIRGITVAKNFRQERTMYNEFHTANEQTYRINVRSGLVFSAVFPLLGTTAGLGTALIVYFGGLQVLDKSVSAGTWFLFVQSIALFWFPLTSIASFWSQFQLGLAAGERVFALMDAQPRVQQTDHQPVPRVKGEIAFRQVDFRYTDQETVLEDFNLHIRAGETVALVGHTGAGKSTLGKLVARFYEFQGGEILIDGRDIRTFQLRAYRRHLGIVPQVPFLFTGSVADNIRYARPESSDAEVEEVARQIGHGDWLEALPEGLATPVGESGRSLSLGQRQLVALARVLLQDPSIIILDEATASVDPLTEAQIQEGLDVVLQGRTAIVIAHRLSTIQHADRIIVLREGQIMEEGTHAALMRAGGHYAQLYNTYVRHQSPDYRPGEGFVPLLVPLEPLVVAEAG
jgi:ABC-type multidrug transport system fused ATPase/permease subunit